MTERSKRQVKCWIRHWVDWWATIGKEKTMAKKKKKTKKNKKKAKNKKKKR